VYANAGKARRTGRRIGKGVSNRTLRRIPVRTYIYEVYSKCNGIFLNFAGLESPIVNIFSYTAPCDLFLFPKNKENLNGPSFYKFFDPFFLTNKNRHKNASDFSRLKSKQRIQLKILSYFMCANTITPKNRSPKPAKFKNIPLSLVTSFYFGPSVPTFVRNSRFPFDDFSVSFFGFLYSNGPNAPAKLGRRLRPLSTVSARRMTRN